MWVLAFGADRRYRGYRGYSGYRGIVAIEGIDAIVAIVGIGAMELWGKCCFLGKKGEIVICFP